LFVIDKELGPEKASQEVGLEIGPIKLKLGDQESVFDNGEWVLGAKISKPPPPHFPQEPWNSEIKTMATLPIPPQLTLQNSSVYSPAGEATPSTSRPQQPGLIEYTSHRGAIRLYYRLSLTPLQLKQLDEVLMVDIWSTAASVRKAAYLSRFPGIKWTEAISHVAEAKTPLKEDLLKRANAEVASYQLSSKSPRFPPLPGFATTPIRLI
jgi:hypothetical protein